MVKPRGASCNLECAYCYYLGKRGLYPSSSFRMSDELLLIFTREYIRAQRVPEVVFSWQGGEPMLAGLDFFRRAMELQRRFRRPGMHIANTIQTNGTLLDDEWGRFLRANGFLVGLSLDGPRDMHNVYRRDGAGEPTFERVMAGLSVLKRHRVDFNILTCVHAANAEHPTEVYQFLRGEANGPGGGQFIQFIPVVGQDLRATGIGDERLASHSVSGRQYGDFLITIFDEWVRHDVGRVFVQVFDVALASWTGQAPGLCVFEPTCGLAMVLEHNGDLFSCDHYVEQQHMLGNVLETPLIELVNSRRQRIFGNDKRERLPEHCRQCDVLFACNGGCPKNRIVRTPDGEYGLSALCDGYRTFFRHIDRPMRFMAAQLAAGRPAASVMRYLER